MKRQPGETGFRRGDSAVALARPEIDPKCDFGGASGHEAAGPALRNLAHLVDKRCRRAAHEARRSATPPHRLHAILQKGVSDIRRYGEPRRRPPAGPAGFPSPAAGLA